MDGSGSVVERRAAGLWSLAAPGMVVASIVSGLVTGVHGQNIYLYILPGGMYGLKSR